MNTHVLRTVAARSTLRAARSRQALSGADLELAEAQRKRRSSLLRLASFGTGVTLLTSSGKEPASGAAMLAAGYAISNGVDASSTQTNQVPDQIAAQSSPPGTPSSDVHTLDDAPSEGPRGGGGTLMESDTVTDTTHSQRAGGGGDNELLARISKRFEAQMAAQKEEMEQKLAAQKEEADEVQKKHTEKIRTLESTQQKLKQHEAREAAQTKKIQQHEAREAAQTKKIQQHEQKLQEYETKDAEHVKTIQEYEAKNAKQMKMLNDCLKPQREAQAKLQSEIQTLGAETKATEAKLSAAEKQLQGKPSAAIHVGVGEDGGQRDAVNTQGWVHGHDYSRCEAASCCSAKEALAQCLVKPEALGSGFDNDPGPYLSQDAGANSCSEGALVSGEEACKKAGAGAFRASVAISGYPKGCITTPSNKQYYYNQHSTGGARSSATPVCHEGYYLNDKASNDCSKGALVASEADCRKAAEALTGSTSLTVVSGSTDPKGCIHDPANGQFYHNTHPTGAAAGHVTPVCARNDTEYLNRIVNRRLARLEEQAKGLEERLEEQSDGCPYNLKKEDDASWCTESDCNAEWNKARGAYLACRWTCSAHCNPALPHAGYQGATYVPAATIADGHRHCDDKYTVMAQEKSTFAGKPLNRHKGMPIRVGVCGKCVSNEYSLHPAYASDGKILGVCRPLVEHDLYVEMDATCGTDGKNDDGSYCSGDPMPLKCQEFVKELGYIQGPNTKKHDFGKFKDGRLISSNDHGGSVEDRALAFTCGHVSITDFSSGVIHYLSATRAHGTVYRLVRGEIAECHSQRESNAHDLGCVNKQVVKSCHSKRVQMNPSNSYDSGADRGLTAAKAAWAALKPSIFEAGVDDDWIECDALALRKATSVGRL